MDRTIVPKNYTPHMSIRETEVAIKKIKDYFQVNLAKELNLTRVSAPLFVMSSTGLNDNLNGVERPVSFGVKCQENERCEIVHSLAKWKRKALKRYGFNFNEGLYTDMNAIRRDEYTDNMHSIYVDQWDWEGVIEKKDRNIDTLKEYVKKIYRVIKSTEKYIHSLYSFLEPVLPDEIKFLETEELERLYPGLTPKEREEVIAKKYGAVFLIGIGGALKSGKPHDGRAPDYDDWTLNGDIIAYYKTLDIAFELSSMGIRVDKDRLITQLKISGHEEWSKLPFQSEIIKEELPFTIGGGIGQSRLCMFFLKKAHIGEVQASTWPDEIIKKCKQGKIQLL
jgi:aspartate--ammonia ligase